MSAIILSGSRIHYEALGHGRPVLFLHGWVGSWRYWIPAMQVASASYRAYALDLFGFGETARDTGRYALEKQAELVSGFLEQMGIGKIALIGHGLGGLVAFSYARHWPESVDRMLVLNCPPVFAAVNSRLYSTTMLDLSGWLSSRAPGADEFLSETLRTDPKAILASMAGLQSNDLFHEIQELGFPCLLVYGQHDPVIKSWMIQNGDTLPQTMHQITLEGAGHFPMMDSPAKFHRLMIDFLALHPGSSPRELTLKEEWKRRIR